jgi:toxin ParE1/3/4
MKEWHVALTEQAEDDLRDIYEYIAFKLLVPETAISLIRRIKVRINKLNVSPTSYAVYPKEPWKSRGLRRRNEGNYAIFFVPVESKRTVVVLRVVYGGRDIKRVLDDTSDIDDVHFEDSGIHE